MAKKQTVTTTLWQVLASALLGAIISLVIMYLTLVKDVYRDLSALEGRLNQRISSLEQRTTAPDQRESAVADVNAPEPAGGVLDMDDPRVTGTTKDNPISVLSAVRVEWSGGRNKVVQVHDYRENGALVFPSGSPHQESSSGVTIPLRPGIYEIKAWEPGTMLFKAAWIEVRAR